MMGDRRVMQEALFYGFSLERHVPFGASAVRGGPPPTAGSVDWVWTPTSPIIQRSPRTVVGEAFAVDASMIVADAHRRRGRGISVGPRRRCLRRDAGRAEVDLSRNNRSRSLTSAARVYS
jgi:hypothetical protein